jgi:hypothetical protein
VVHGNSTVSSRTTHLYELYLIDGTFQKCGRPDTPGHADIKRGAGLMQDMGQVIRNKPPFAYPHDEWRWGEPLPIDVESLTAKDLRLD